MEPTIAPGDLLYARRGSYIMYMLVLRVDPRLPADEQVLMLWPGRARPTTRSIARVLRWLSKNDQRGVFRHVSRPVM